MAEMTTRLALPLIAPGQAQKEVAHNEALARIDMIVQASALTIGDDAPPGTPMAGDCWIIGNSPTGAWAGYAGQVAGWTEGGWRFVAPRAGMQLWVESAQMFARYDGTGWNIGEITASSLSIDGNVMLSAPVAAIGTPTGGTTVDTEARATLATIISALSHHGLTL